MKCPFCASQTTEVVETRDSEDLSLTRRRRSCIKCTKRFTTYERVESVPITVIKKSGSREQFDRDKLIKGMANATEKTSITSKDIMRFADEIERELRMGESTEVGSMHIGELVAKKLKEKDKVAYIRFASVFKRFVDLDEFEIELQKTKQ